MRGDRKARKVDTTRRKIFEILYAPLEIPRGLDSAHFHVRMTLRIYYALEYRIVLWSTMRIGIVHRAYWYHLRCV